LKSKKNRILLKLNELPVCTEEYKSVLNGVLIQGTDEGNYMEWKEVGGRESTDAEKQDLKFANLVCKHLKSNAIAL
jgi:phosphoribosylaminoimidazolecarboxamide formyltransferase/IMP cyclohydrolase